MASYFISFDLATTANEEDRKSAAEQIREAFPQNFHPISNGWIINTEQYPEDIRLWLFQLIHPSTRGIVIRIPDSMWGDLPDDAELPVWFMLQYRNL